MINQDIQFKEKLHEFIRLLNQADAVLIGAGSGLSADTGLDYLDPDAFAQRYPAMLQYGFKTNMELMGLTQSNGAWDYLK